MKRFQQILVASPSLGRVSVSSHQWGMGTVNTDCRKVNNSTHSAKQNLSKEGLEKHRGNRRLSLVTFGTQWSREPGRCAQTRQNTFAG